MTLPLQSSLPMVIIDFQKVNVLTAKYENNPDFKRIFINNNLCDVIMALLFNSPFDINNYIVDDVSYDILEDIIRYKDEDIDFIEQVIEDVRYIISNTMDSVIGSTWMYYRVHTPMGGYRFLLEPVVPNIAV